MSVPSCLTRRGFRRGLPSSWDGAVLSRVLLAPFPHSKNSASSSSKFPPRSAYSFDVFKRNYATASFGGRGNGQGNVGVEGCNSNGEVLDANVCISNDLPAVPTRIASTLTVTLQNLEEIETGISSNLPPPPALHVAASEGRSAMELVLRTQLVVPTEGNDNPSRTLEQQQQLQHLRDGIIRHRQSLKEAAESLLKATKATGLLADSIAEIRCQQKPSTEECATETLKLSVQELHKAFLSLTQSLLDCLDAHPLDSHSSITSGWQRRSSKNSSTVPTDDQLIELLLILSYRSHQLSLPFHFPLYQRMALTLAQQPHVSTLRSRAEWIWNIHQWSQLTWGEKYTPSGDGRNKQLQHQDRVDWFRPSLLALAEGQYWSDLNYLLRHLLQPSFAKLRHGGEHGKLRSSIKRSNRMRSRGRTMIPDPEPSIPLIDQFHLDKNLTRSLLLALERHGVLPKLWNNLQHPSPTEDDVLEILLLLEASIWTIFEYPPNTPAPAALARNGITGSHVSPSSPPDDIPRFSLRQAIEVLLKTPPKEASYDPGRGINDDGEDTDDEDDYDQDYDSFAMTLEKLNDVLRDDEELLDDDADSQRQYTPEIVSLAALLWDPFWEGKDGKSQPLNSNKRIPRDLEVRVTRSGDHHILEVAILGNDAASRSRSATESTASADWNSDESCFPPDALEFIYARTESYHDAIPDVTHQLYHHNGNRKVRYSSSLEQEIYQQFQNPSPGYFEDDEDGETDMDE